MKKLKKDVIGFVGSNIILGVGSVAVGATGGNIAGLSAMGDFMPTIGTAMMAGHTLRMVKKIPKHKGR